MTKRIMVTLFVDVDEFERTAIAMQDAGIDHKRIHASEVEMIQLTDGPTLPVFGDDIAVPRAPDPEPHLWRPGMRGRP